MRLEGKNILISGAYGRLGKELVPLLKEEGALVMAPSRQEWDICLHPCGLAMPSIPDIIIHAASYTDVAGAELNKTQCEYVNVIGTKRVSKLAHALKAKMVYISSDYVNVSPMGFYAFTKKAGEYFVDEKNDMIIRTSFKSRDLWGEEGLKEVFHPVYTNADWTDVIAKKIKEAVCLNLTGVVNIGTERKTLLDLAYEAYEDVKVTPVHEADKKLGYSYPRDTCMELTI